MISLNSHILINKVRFLSLLPSGGGKRDPERVGFLPKVTQETVTEASRSSRVSVADSPPPLTRLAPPIAALRGGAHPPPLSVRQPSVWVSTRLQRCAPPQPPAPRRERQALAAPGPRPTPAADRRQRLRPRTPQRVSRSRRGKGAAPARGTSLASSLLSALKGSPAPATSPPR